MHFVSFTNLPVQTQIIELVTGEGMHKYIWILPNVLSVNREPKQESAPFSNSKSFLHPEPPDQITYSWPSGSFSKTLPEGLYAVGAEIERF